MSFLNFSCQKEFDQEENPVRVSFKSYKLRNDEILKILPKNYTKNDSIELVEAYIKVWLKKKLTYENAKSKMTRNNLQFIDKQVEQYKEDLVLNEFYNSGFLNKINQQISENEMMAYFHKNKESFVLNEDIIQMQFVITPPSNLKEVDNYFKNNNLEAIVNLQNKDIEYYFDANQWILISEFENKIPDLKILVTQFSKTKEKMIFNTINNKNYLVKIFNYIPKGNIGPYAYFKNTIKAILINKRKVNLQESLEDSLYNEALENQKINYYE